MPRSVATHGRTADNPRSPRDFREAVEAIYAGTRLGRQELDGLLLEDLPGALWTREMIEKARVTVGGGGSTPSPLRGEGWGGGGLCGMHRASQTPPLP